MESNDRMVPRICSEANMYQGKKYDARLLLARMKDKEVCANNYCHVQPWCELPQGHMSWYVLIQIVPVLDVTPTERNYLWTCHAGVPPDGGVPDVY